MSNVSRRYATMSSLTNAMVAMAMARLKFNMLFLMRIRRNIRRRWVRIIRGPIRLGARLMDLEARALIGSGPGRMGLDLVSPSFIARTRPLRSKGGLDSTLDRFIISRKTSFSSTAKYTLCRASSTKSTKSSKRERILPLRKCLFIQCLKSKDPHEFPSYGPNIFAWRYGRIEELND